MPEREVLPDLLQPGLDLVICGTAAGDESAKRGAYYADRRNKFYRTLHSVGLTDHVLLPCEYSDLLGYSIGLTDLIKVSHGSDRSMAGDQWDCAGLWDKVRRYNPKFLAFNGKKAAERALSLRHVLYCLLPQRIGGTALFVCPSTSGAASRYWDELLWRRLSDEIQQS